MYAPFYSLSHKASLRILFLRLCTYFIHLTIYLGDPYIAIQKELPCLKKKIARWYSTVWEHVLFNFFLSPTVHISFPMWVNVSTRESLRNGLVGSKGMNIYNFEVYCQIEEGPILEHSGTPWKILRNNWENP